MNDFNKLEALGNEHDKSGMLDLVKAFPSQMEDAWQRGRRFLTSLSAPSINKVVVCGMGGSAIGGDLVRSYLGDELRVPLFVNRGYEVPPSLHENAFFVFSSYSGNTGETLSAYESLRGRPAAAITSGGKLEQFCLDDDVPVCAIPGGMPPRAAIAYSFFPLLQVLSSLGVAKVDDNEYREAHSALEALRDLYSSPQPENSAAEIATRLANRLPFVYSGAGLLESVARRWSCQFNENSKTLAHYAVFPELCHNEISAWEALASIRSEIAIVALMDEDDHRDATRQADVTLQRLENRSNSVIRVEGFSGGRMKRVLSAMMLGDFVSVYLAYLNGIDPTPVDAIESLKKRLHQDRT